MGTQQLVGARAAAGQLAGGVLGGVSAGQYFRAARLVIMPASLVC